MSNGFLPTDFTTAALLNNNWTVNTTAAHARVFKFMLHHKVLVGRATMNRGTTTQTGHIMVAGIYDDLANLVFQTPSFDMGSSGISTQAIATKWLLLPGNYWFAIASDATNTSCMLFSSTGMDVTLLGSVVTQATVYGHSTNTMTAGALPSALGAVSASVSENTIPAVYFEP